jgi:hypothetical protein
MFTTQAAAAEDLQALEEQVDLAAAEQVLMRAVVNQEMLIAAEAEAVKVTPLGQQMEQVAQE